MLNLLIFSIISIGSLAFSTNCRAESGKNDKDERYATRPLEKGTAIKLIIRDTEVPALLNDSKSATSLIAKLPYAVKLQRYAQDYCGVMNEALPYDSKSMRNGDIAFAVDGNYFTRLYKNEDISEQFDGIVNMGIIKAPLSVMDTLDGSIPLRIELE